MRTWSKKLTHDDRRQYKTRWKMLSLIGFKKAKGASITSFIYIVRLLTKLWENIAMVTTWHGNMVTGNMVTAF